MRLRERGRTRGRQIGVLGEGVLKTLEGGGWRMTLRAPGRGQLGQMETWWQGEGWGRAGDEG